jgi:hypothetical protein
MPTESQILKILTELHPILSFSESNPTATILLLLITIISITTIFKKLYPHDGELIALPLLMVSLTWVAVLVCNPFSLQKQAQYLSSDFTITNENTNYTTIEIKTNKETCIIKTENILELQRRFPSFKKQYKPSQN